MALLDLQGMETPIADRGKGDDSELSVLLCGDDSGLSVTLCD